MKRTIGLILGILLMASTAFAANGDLIVDGLLGVGTATPGAKLDVNGTVKIQNSSVISASRGNGNATPEYPYYFELTIDGDPNTFYPVALMSANNGGVPGKFVISRVYTEPGPTGLAGQPTAQHIGGLMAMFSTMNTCWSDYCYISLERYRYTYVRTIADYTHLPVESNGRSVIIRLRGGGFRYRFYANYDLSPVAVIPGAVAYSSSTYTYYYPDAIALSSLPNNAFAQNTDVPVDGNGNIGGIGAFSKLSVTAVLGQAYKSMLTLDEAGNSGLSSMGVDWRFAGSAGYPWGATGRLEVARQGTSSSFDMLFHTALTGTLSEKMRILANGNVGIGTTTPIADAKLQVIGNIYANNTLLTSDAKFKKNLNTISTPLSKVLSLNGLSYEWKADEYKEKNLPEGRHYGVIAQEIEKILPEVVKTDAKGEKTVAYSEIIPVLIEAIKEQQKLIEKQQGELAEIKKLVQQGK